jgi:flavorubredoxin
MVKAIEKIKPLEFDVICPGHGRVHRGNLKNIIELAEQFSKDYLNLPGNKPVK